MIEADRDKIASVLANLISNAVKYSPKGKEIDVKCEIVGTNALVSVSDYGIGINAEDIRTCLTGIIEWRTSIPSILPGLASACMSAPRSFAVMRVTSGSKAKAVRDRRFISVCPYG